MRWDSHGPAIQFNSPSSCHKPDPGPGPRFATLEERHELFQRAGEILRAGYLSGLVLCLQEAIECGDEDAGYVVGLQADGGAGVRICPRREAGYLEDDSTCFR